MAPDGDPRPPTMVLPADDPLIIRRLNKLAGERGMVVVSADEAEGTPSVAVLNLDAVGSLSTARTWHEQWPETLVAAYSAVPDRELWLGAQRAGCDLVVNRGALVVKLTERLRDAPGGRALHRFPLFDAADAAGRLGCVFRTEDTPVGPLAVYRVEGRMWAVADRCPHAGAVLSTGEVEGTVVTCPGHGSQFDVCTGDRVRGPADTEVRTYSLVQDGGQVFVVLPG